MEQKKVASTTELIVRIFINAAIKYSKSEKTEKPKFTFIKGK